MPITLRSAKGSPLTHDELDGNFSYIQDHSNLENLLDITSHPQYTLTADMTRYSVTSHTHPYLPLSGGTVTGGTTFAGHTTFSNSVNFYDTIRFYNTPTFTQQMVLDSQGSAFSFSFQNLSDIYFANDGDPFTTTFVGGNIIADSFDGDGTDITNVNAVQLGSNLPSYYSATSHTHSYLPISGGTVTGGTYFTNGLSATTLSGNASSLTAGNSDLLEGHNASYFAISDHDHLYLPLTGGIVTGDIEVENGVLTVQAQGSSASTVVKHIGAGGFHKNSDTFSAAMAISGFPLQSLMYNIKIRGYDYRYSSSIYTGTWECTIGAYWDNSLNTWRNPTVTIDGYAPFSSISAVKDADNNPVILLGTTATPWRYTSFEIDVTSFYNKANSPIALETWELSNVNLEDIFNSISGATPAIYVDPTLDNRTKFKGNIVHSGDEWVVGTTDWNRLKFATNGLSRMTIIENGNVGIGTTNPAGHRLSLSAVNNNATPALSILNQTDDGDTSISLINTEQTMTLGIDNTDRGKFKISDYHQLGTDDRFVIDKSGNVGINTSSPRSTFHVSGATNQNGLVSILNFEDPTDGWYNFKLKTGIPWNTSNTGFKTFMSKLIIDGWYYESSVKLEIGSYIFENYWFSPSVQCLTRQRYSCPTITGAVENGFIVFQFSASPVGAYGTFQLSMIEGDDAEDYDYTQFAFVEEALAATAEKIYELPYRGWNQNDTLYIRDGLNANVGIGTSAAEAKLHICEDMNNRAMFVRDEVATVIIEDEDARLQLASKDTGTYGSAIIMTTSSHSWSMWQTTSNDNYRFYIGYKDSGIPEQYIPENSARYLTFENNGWLGIGTENSAAEAKLHIKENDTDETLQLYLENEGTGDVGIKMENISNAFSMGIDYNAFKISNHTGLGTNDRFKIDADGDFWFLENSTNDEAVVNISSNVWAQYKEYLRLGANNWFNFGDQNGRPEIRFWHKGDAAATAYKYTHSSASSYQFLPSRIQGTISGISFDFVTTSGDRLDEFQTSSFSSKFYVGNNGKVGIGTDDPLYNLHVGGSGVTRFLVESNSDDQASFDLLGGGNHIRWITDEDYATRLYKQSGDYRDLFTIDYDGNAVFTTSISADTDKQVQVANGGPDGSRPVSPVLYEMFFDTTLGKPIWYTGSDWVDATGASV